MIDIDTYTMQTYRYLYNADIYYIYRTFLGAQGNYVVMREAAVCLGKKYI